MNKIYTTILITCLALAGYTQDANLEWARQIGGSDLDTGYSIATDANGNVYTRGFFEGTVDFDPGPGVQNLTSSENYRTFIQKLDADGNLLWVKQTGGGNFYYLHSPITVDNLGNIYIQGDFQGTIDFDPGSSTQNLTASSGFETFIQKLDTNGNLLWVKQMGGSGEDRGNSITIDISGNAYTTGRFEETTDFDPGSGVQNFTSGGWYDIFVQKLDPDGNFLWAGQMGGSDRNSGSSIATDFNGNVYTTGNFYGTADFDPGPSIQNLSAVGSYDIFIQKLANTTVGLNNYIKDTPFVVYPNPTTGNFAIEFDKIQKSLTVRLLSISGQLIEHENFRNTHLIQMNVRHPSGIYILELLDDNGNKATLKLVKE